MPVSAELAERLLRGMEHNRVFLTGSMRLNKAAMEVYDRDLAELRHVVWEDRAAPQEPVKPVPPINSLPLELDGPQIKLTHVQTKTSKKGFLSRWFTRLGSLMS